MIGYCDNCGKEFKPSSTGILVQSTCDDCMNEEYWKQKEAEE